MPIIDLSTTITTSPPGTPDLIRVALEHADHVAGAATIQSVFQIPPALLRDGEGWAVETFFDLIQTIRRAYQGKTTLAPEAAQALVEQLQQPARAQVELTRREWAVLRLMAHGQSNGEIAEQLHISAATVKGHVGTILEKLGVTTRAEAIAHAWTQGLVRRDDPPA